MKTNKYAAVEEGEDVEENEQIEDMSDNDELDFVNNELVKCRYYRNEVPQEKQLVMVQITKIQEMGAYVSLLEYDNLEGFIMMSDVTNKRVKSVYKLLKAGKQEIMEVRRVENTRNTFIDLSKKNIQQTDYKAAESNFKKAKVVHGIMRNTAVKLNQKVVDLYEQFGWKLYDIFGTAYEAFRMITVEPEAVFSKIKIDEEQQAALVEMILRKMAKNPMKIRADFELTCYNFEGIMAIREALMTAREKVNEANFKVDFKIIAPPKYKCETLTLDKVKGYAKLNEGLEIVKQVIKTKKGTFKLLSEPTVIGAKEEEEAEDLMAEIEQHANDSDESEDQEEGIEVDVEDDDVEVAADEQSDEEHKE